MKIFFQVPLVKLKRIKTQGGLPVCRVLGDCKGETPNPKRRLACARAPRQERTSVYSENRILSTWTLLECDVRKEGDDLEKEK